MHRSLRTCKVNRATSDSSFSIEWSELTRPMTGLEDRDFHVRRLERGIAVPTSRGHVRNDGPIRAVDDRKCAAASEGKHEHFNAIDFR
jgi:hypothetical protein